jgi:hypothetical protein
MTCVLRSQCFVKLSNSPHFVEREGSLPCSQEPATFRCPQPLTQMNPIHLFSIHFNTILPFLLGLPSGLCHSGLCTKTTPVLANTHKFPPPPHIILIDLISGMIFAETKNTNREYPHYTV